MNDLNLRSDTEYKPLKLSAEARLLHDELLELLFKLEKDQYESCLDPHFRNQFSEILSRFSVFQRAVTDNENKIVTCSKGCCECCYHWVEDVNSFEAQIIADYIKQNFPEKIAQIVQKCKEDSLELERIHGITVEKLSKIDNCTSRIDEIDLLLSAYYQLKRPCPLLDKNGCCSVYEVRPLTCRVYMSFSDPKRCRPENVNDYDVVTYLLDFEEEASEVIDRLHFRYLRFDEDTGLRSLLVKYLE